MVHVWQLHEWKGWRTSQYCPLLQAVDAVNPVLKCDLHSCIPHTTLSLTISIISVHWALSHVLLRQSWEKFWRVDCVSVWGRRKWLYTPHVNPHTAHAVAVQAWQTPVESGTAHGHVVCPMWVKILILMPALLAEPPVCTRRVAQPCRMWLSGCDIRPE